LLTFADEIVVRGAELSSGLNLAAADVRLLHEDLVEYQRSARTALIDEYPTRALSRTWQATRVSWWLTALMHRFSEDAFAAKLPFAELEHLAESRAALDKQSSYPV